MLLINRNKYRALFIFKLLQWLAVSFPVLLCSQEITVRGVVTGSDFNEPLIGVNILIKGSDRGTTSDIDGGYELTVPQGSILQFSYIGYKSIELPAESQTLDLTLDPDIAELDQVVVVGYGTSKKRDLTGFRCFDQI